MVHQQEQAKRIVTQGTNLAGHMLRATERRSLVGCAEGIASANLHERIKVGYPTARSFEKATKGGSLSERSLFHHERFIPWVSKRPCSACGVS